MNPDLFNQISDSLPYGVRLRTLDFVNGLAIIDYESISIEGPSLFAQNLKNRALFKEIDYKGFSKEVKSKEIEKEEIVEIPQVMGLEELSTEKNKEEELEVKKEESYIYHGILEVVLEGGY